jgi:hypothetical protein
MTIITILLTLFFIFAGSIKLLGWQTFIFETQLKFFIKYGLNRSHMFYIGVIELSAAISLASATILDFEILNVLGALGISFTSIGAIFFHLRFDTVKDAIPAIITLLLSTILIMSNHALLNFGIY